MNLYIPEIGDELILSEDWTFTLHREHRNMSLGNYLGYYNCFNYQQNIDGWVKESDFENLKPFTGIINYPTKEEIDAKCKGFFGVFDYKLEQKLYNDAKANSVDYNNYLNYLNKWRENVINHVNPNLSVTLNAGVVLKVDRVYIRKGLSDFSSITFYAKNLGKVKFASNIFSNSKIKSIRFWAKLSDCNTIKFDEKCLKK
jgi:hypothetical protein